MGKMQVRIKPGLYDLWGQLMLPCYGRIPMRGRCKIEKPRKTCVNYLKIDLRLKRKKSMLLTETFFLPPLHFET